LGGEKTDGRWHTAVRGKRIVYLSQHPALALIEALANLNANPNLFPDAYQLIKIHVADGVSTGALTSQDCLGNGVKTATRLRRPGTPAWPESLNYLFNSLHGDAGGITVEWCKWIEYDERLFHKHESFRAKTKRTQGDRK
jgi:RES domain-containing protein